MPMSPTQEERHSNQSPTGRLKSYGGAIRIKRASSGLLFESENSRSSVPCEGSQRWYPRSIRLATGSASCDLFQLDDSGTIEPVRKPNGQGVRIIARNRAPSGFEVRFPTTKVISISVSPTMVIAPGSSTRRSKRCFANLSRVSRPELGDGSRTAICQRSLGTDWCQGRSLQRL